MSDLVHDCFKPGSKLSKPDKPDLTKPGLTRNLAKANPGEPENICHKCISVKPGPQKKQIHLDPNKPGGTLFVSIYAYIYIY